MAFSADITPSSLVLVTGANGHVAQHVLQQLLSRPAVTRPRIRASVRSEASAQTVKAVFASSVADGNLDIILVPDISIPGVFDDAVQDCTHVAHIASPIAVNPADVENDLLKPAIRGTSSVINSCLKATSVKAVVVTSSFAAAFDPEQGFRKGYTYTPEDWNPISYEEASSPQLDVSKYPETYRNYVTYMASKKLAEKAAWDLWTQNKPKWSLSTVLPTYIGGPSVLPLTRGADSLSFSNKLLWTVAQSAPTDKLDPVDFPNWVDVRDVARMHIEALGAGERASGQRFVAAPIKTSYTGIADSIRREFPTIKPSEEQQKLETFDIESPNIPDVLGITQWISRDIMIKDIVMQMQQATA